MLTHVAIGEMSTDLDRRWLYRVGGLSALALGVAYVVTIPLYATVGAPPSDGAAWLHYLAGKTTRWWIILALSVLTDFLYIPVALALYDALQDVHRSAMRIATGLVGLFIALDLAVTWSNYGSLIMLGSRFATAAVDAQRAADVAAANYAAAVLASPLEVVYSIVTLSTAILIIGLVMRRSVFNRITAYIGVSTGVVGILALTGSSLAVIINAVLATVWILLVGYRLYRWHWN